MNIQTKHRSGAFLLGAAAVLLSGCALKEAQVPNDSPLPASLPVGSGAPEDIKVIGSIAYVSNVADGSVLKLDLAKNGAASTFIPAATDAYRSTWGLRVVPTKNWLLAIQNQPYDFNPAHAQAGRVAAYDLASGAKVASWDLPAQTVGNSVDVDKAGNIYVGDFGPTSRLVRIDPATNEISTWATSSQWVNGGFGIGGMVYNGTGLYAAHNNVLWYIGINADGTAATPQAVKIAGDPTIFADGMTWADGSIIYAENDVTVPGAHGTVYRVQFGGPTTATRVDLHSDLRDPSEVTVANVKEQDYLLVNESQLGYALGVDKGKPSTPYQVKVFPL